MSACIIPMRHFSRSIELYMGKLRFTLTGIIFWIVLLLSCFLSENFAILNSNPRGGFSFDSAFILTLSIIVLLILYYFLEHKKNGLTFDRILLPCITIAGLLFIWTIFRQENRSFTNSDGTGVLEITFDKKDCVMASLQVVIWLSVVYALIFVYNRFRLNKESYRWVGKVYLISVLVMVLIDLIYEGKTIATVFTGNFGFGGVGLMFFFGNANVWSLLLFAGLLTTIVLSYKKFNLCYFITMLFLYAFNILTLCSTTVFIETFIVAIYIIYEIIYHFRGNKKQGIINLIILFGCLGVLFILFILFKKQFISVYHNIIGDSTLHKYIFSIAGRTGIWEKTLDLLKGNLLDLVFGLGHQTANEVFRAYMSSSLYGIKTTHNAFMEVLLRYGILGLALYLIMVVLTIVCLIRYIIKKKYRFAFIYGLCFLAIMMHSMAESTTLFTPNVGGLYFSFVFILPILNILQEKRFKALKDDLKSVDISKKKVDQRAYVSACIYILFAVTIARIIVLVFSIDLFSAIMVFILIVTAGLVFISIYRNKSEYNPLKALANNHFVYYRELIIKEKDDEK